MAAGRAFVVATFRLRFGLGGPDAQAEACDYGRRWWHKLASKHLLFRWEREPAGRAFVVATFRLRFGLGGPDTQAEACDYGRRWWHELA